MGHVPDAGAVPAAQPMAGGSGSEPPTESATATAQPPSSPCNCRAGFDSVHMHMAENDEKTRRLILFCFFGLLLVLYVMYRFPNVRASITESAGGFGG